MQRGHGRNTVATAIRWVLLMQSICLHIHILFYYPHICFDSSAGSAERKEVSV